MRLHAAILYAALVALVVTQAWTALGLRAQRRELAEERERSQAQEQEIQVQTARIGDLRTIMQQEAAKERDRSQAQGRRLEAHAGRIDELETAGEAMRNQQLRELESTLEDVRKHLIQRLGEIASTGQPEAVDEIRKVAEKLYDGVDHNGEAERMRANLTLMRAALHPIALAAGNGDQGALQTLLDAGQAKPLRPFIPDAVGTAAAMGNRQALEALLNYDRHDWLLSSSVFALREAAEKEVPEAVDFLVNVVDDDSRRALWYGAAQGLRGSASAGNPRVQAALAKYAAHEEARRREKKNTQAE